MYGDCAKYIVVEYGTAEEIFIFGATIDHSSMASTIDRKVVSAGSINYDLSCFGESTSLKLKSRPGEDTRLALLTFGTDAEDMKLRRGHV